MRGEAATSNRNGGKNEFYLTYDSGKALLAGDGARTRCIFYLEEEQEEDGASASIAWSFPNREQLLK
jgi:hypothetical protein